MTLTEFLLARIAEDEAIARAEVERLRGAARRGGKTTAARRRVECEAKRRIIELHTDLNAEYRWDGDDDPLPGICSVCHDRSEHQQERWPCPTLRLLALPFADHPELDESWRP